MTDKSIWGWNAIVGHGYFNGEWEDSLRVESSAIESPQRAIQIAGDICKRFNQQKVLVLTPGGTSTLVDKEGKVTL
jgi:hypothetical protein